MRKSIRTEKALILNPVLLLGGLFDIKINKKILFVIFFSLVFSFSLFYILKINRVVYYSYQLEELQKNAGKLLQENEKLEKSLAGKGSLSDIEGKVAELGFERVNKIHYIQETETTVASAR